MSGPPTTIAWLSLGCNLGHRGRALDRLRSELSRPAGVTIEAASREILTRAVGTPPQPDFHNQVVRLRSETPLTPEGWLQLCQAAEARAGRRPTYPWGPRRADADILLLGAQGEVRTAGDEPAVPHPRLGERPFLGALLAELGRAET